VVLLAAGCLLVALTVVLGLRRWSVWRWLAVLAAVPVLWTGLVAAPEDGSVAATVLTSGGVLLACWRARPGAATLAGALLPAGLGVAAFWLLGGDVWRPSAGGWVVVALPAVLGAAGAAGLGRAGHSPARLPAAVALLVPGLVTLACAGDALVAVAWWPAAGAVGLTALLRGRRGAAAARPQVDEVDRQAMAAFAAESERPLAPVAVVIAAYNEAAGLPAVLASMPRTVCGLPVDVVVVDDGSSDGTTEAARSTGRARVVRCEANRGQGAALRLGYRIAREHGAGYVVTTDADGQYDVADLPLVLQPVVDGRADFVTGSRRLGVQENRDAVRHAGTYVFAWLTSALVGQWITDTSFGLRAMRAEVTAAVTLNQPQYQSSELLIGAISHGFRVLEVPATMHVRSAGSSKKGGNLVYGSRYARVVLGTWWREGCPTPLAGCAPALRPSRGGEPVAVA
jgi:hypothetical protein